MKPYNAIHRGTPALILIEIINLHFFYFFCIYIKFKNIIYRENPVQIFLYSKLKLFLCAYIKFKNKVYKVSLKYFLYLPV